MAERSNRKKESVRRANRMVYYRTMLVMLVLGVLTFLALFYKLYDLQIRRHEELQERAVSQQTRKTSVSASRGTIFDCNGNILAISATAEKIILSPLELNEKGEDGKIKQDLDALAADLAELLGLEQDSIRQKMDKTWSQYEVLVSQAEQEVSDRLRTYLNEHSVHGVYLLPAAKRYYPYSTLAAHAIGFVRTDDTGVYGVYGLEAAYQDELEGQNGLVITAKDGSGQDLLYQYEQYFDAENGCNLVLTIDTTMQYYLEKGLEEAIEKYGAKNGGTGLILDVNTGAIRAMASYPTYDLNNPREIIDSRLLSGVSEEELADVLGELQLKQWRSKVLNDTYEPGSTGKILTLSMALEEGTVDFSSTYNCSGSTVVSGQRIGCSKKAGHGHQTLIEAVGNSCNPAFIDIGLSVDSSTYYRYMRDFGLMEATGIELAGEATGIFIAEERFQTLDQACYAFGQNYTVTPLALLSAQAACVNGGYLRTPYLVEEVTDSEGNVIRKHDSTPVRQVISEETSAKVREALEYVVASGTGRNGQVAGYRLGGKTGTADKSGTRTEDNPQGDVVVSFVCFAPADDPEVIMLLTLDTPSRTTGTYVSGGNMVAPASSSIMAEILPYLGYEPQYTAEELEAADATVPYVVKQSRAAAEATLEESGFAYKIIGDGETVTDQTPAGGAIIPGNATVILYCGAEKSDAPCTVPSVVGLSTQEANLALTNAGLIMKVSGTEGSGNPKVIGQSVSAGTQVEAGTVVTVQLGAHVTD